MCCQLYTVHFNPIIYSLLGTQEEAEYESSFGHNFKMAPEFLLLCLLELTCFMFFLGCFPPAFCFHFILFIYLFNLFLAVLGLCCCARAFSSCSERGLLFVVVRWLLVAVASLVAEQRL